MKTAPTRLPVAFKSHICFHDGEWHVYASMFGNDAHHEAAWDHAEKLNDPVLWAKRKKFDAEYAAPEGVMYSRMQKAYVYRDEWYNNERRVHAQHDRLYRDFLASRYS